MTTFVYGIHPVEELLRAAPDAVLRVLVDRPDRLTVDADVPVETVSTDELDRLTGGGNHQGVAAETAPFRYTALEDILVATAEATTACVLLLDQVQDPQNFGAILRSAAAFGVDAVVITKDRACPVTPTVIRASSGLAYRTPVVRITNLARTLEALAEEGFWGVATVMDGETDLWEMDFVMKTALVLGGEGTGIRRLVEERCDFRARIPMHPGVESLNVSVAAAVCLYEVARQRP